MFIKRVFLFVGPKIIEVDEITERKIRYKKLRLLKIKTQDMSKYETGERDRQGWNVCTKKR